MDSLTRAREWQRFAEMDFSSAEYLLDMHPVPLEIICYHCQQSAEEYLKGYLVLHGINPPKIHDLDELCKLCMKWSDTFKEIADQCSDLTVYGVQPRYPMELTLERRDMQQMVILYRFSLDSCWIRTWLFLGFFGGAMKADCSNLHRNTKLT